MADERMARVETKLYDIEKKLDKFIDSAEDKFASKITEKIVYGLVTLVLVAVTTKLLKLW
jgi:tetrahydromethanopterin S-methyltransferase subunit G